ncbi:MAG: acyltransferase family protein [Succinivibrio sp.]
MLDKRQDIDGLKGIAILSVVFYHFFDLLKSGHFTDSALFDGGFLGVDIFFVISGFLITASILGKVKNDSFSLVSFYKRRFLRIVPPLLFVCIFSLIVGYFLLFPDVYDELNKEVANALLFICNFRFANSGGYFALTSSDKPLLHTWYLAVTIQFYILFPLVVLLLKKLFSLEKLPLAMAVVFVLLTIASVVVARNGIGYLLTQCRIFELFFGSVLFLYKDLVYKKVFSVNSVLPIVAEVLGIVIIITSIFTVELKNGTWTTATSLPTMLGTALVILSHNRKSVLNFAPLTLLGRCSYSLYLWHWPIFVFAIRSGYTDTLFSCSVVIAVVLIFTALSFLLVEKKKVDYRITLPLFVLCFVSYAYFHHVDGKNYLANYTVPIPQDLVLDKKYMPTVAFQKGDQTVWHYGLQTETPKIFFVGDSNLGHYIWYLRNENKKPVYALARAAIMAYGEYFTGLKVIYYDSLKDKADYYELYRSTLDKLKDGDKVVLCGRWEILYDAYRTDNNLPKNKESFDKYLAAVIDDLKEQIVLHKNLKFYLVGNSYNPNQTSIILTNVILSGSAIKHVINTNNALILKDYKDNKTDLINKKLKEFSDSMPNVSFIDRNVPLITKDGFILHKDNVGIFYDPMHYSLLGGAYIGKYIMEQIESN